MKEEMAMNIHKISVAIVYNRRQEAVSFIEKFVPSACIVRQRKFQIETDLLRVSFIKANSQFIGKRFNYVYTTKEIAETEWFNTVIRPMLYGGVAEFPEIHIEEIAK